VQPHSQGAELTRLARFASLHAYTCVLAPTQTGGRPVRPEIIMLTAMSSQFLPMSTYRWISGVTHRRDQCTADLIKLFGRDTLIETREFVRPFDANKFT
jgi:hypothetical protein